jgi:hypothetical protein
MALNVEELEQIRAIVRSEIASAPASGRKVALVILGTFLALLFGIIGLHILVIGGFTVYHLMAHH